MYLGERWLIHSSGRGGLRRALAGEPYRAYRAPQPGTVNLQEGGSRSPAQEGQTKQESWEEAPTHRDEHQDQRAPPGQPYRTAFRCLCTKGRASPRPSAQAALLLMRFPSQHCSPCSATRLPSASGPQALPQRTGIKEELDTVTPKVPATLAHLLGPPGALPACLPDPGLAGRQLSHTTSHMSSVVPSEAARGLGAAAPRAVGH